MHIKDTVVHLKLYSSPLCTNLDVFRTEIRNYEAVLREFIQLQTKTSNAEITVT